MPTANEIAADSADLDIDSPAAEPEGKSSEVVVVDEYTPPQHRAAVMALGLPASGDVNTWTEREYAMAQAAGLVNKQFGIAPRDVAEAFLAHCRRTGLDPIARQIYCIPRAGVWGIQTSIDGFRVVAERTGKYRGQTPAQWTDGTRKQIILREDGKIVRDGNGNPVTEEGFDWMDVWPHKDKQPYAARVGVLHADFAEPVYVTARFDAYQAGGPMWRKMPDLMIAKCAEALALRKAFPQDLSGLYTSEEMDQANTPATARNSRQAGAPAAAEPASQPQSTINWDLMLEEALQLSDRAAVLRGWKYAKANGAPQEIIDKLVEHGRGLAEPAAEPAEEAAPAADAVTDPAHPDYVAPEGS